MRSINLNTGVFFVAGGLFLVGSAAGQHPEGVGNGDDVMVGPPREEGLFKRGDANCDGVVDAYDAEFLKLLLNRFAQPLCGLDAADVDDDGQITVNDAVWVLNYAEGVGQPPPPPGPDQCGPDPTPDGFDAAGYPDEICAIVHCCLPDGSCVLTCRQCCSQQQGTPVAACLGDSNRNGTDDACEPATPEPTPTPVPQFVRGDSNGDGTADISDAIFQLGCLFRGGRCPDCLAAADSNDDGQLDMSDAIFLLAYLYRAGPELPAPGSRACGADITGDALGCRASTVCGFGCACSIEKIKFEEVDGKPKFEVSYDPAFKPEGEKGDADRLKYKTKLLIDLTAAGDEGTVKYKITPSVTMSLYKGTRADVEAWLAEVRAGNTKKADELWKKLDPRLIDLKQGKEDGESLSGEVNCPFSGTLEQELEGDFWWQGADYRIGTADKPQTRSFLLRLTVKVECGADSKTAHLMWTGDVGWEGGKVKISNAATY